MNRYINLFIGVSLCLSITSCKGQEQNTATAETQEKVEQPMDKTAQVVHRVGVDDFKAQMGAEVQLVDVRTPEEYAAGHIGEALNYNVNGADFKKQVESLDKSKPVLVYCKMGGRSARAAKMLEEMGFTTIYDLEGGYTDWAKQ